VSGKAIGIGGVFFRARDPKTLARWYGEALGVSLDDSGNINFVPDASGRMPLTVWAPFEEETRYFGKREQQAMINYCVDDLDAVLERLRAKGATIDSKREDHDYGRFAWAFDPEGNRFELWEPKP
jgi:predicted enzyme related to lactoylglutathione lyase